MLSIQGLPCAANVSMMFSDIPFSERFAVARKFGFDFVECWWPFSESSPSVAVVDDFFRRLAESDLKLAAINLFAGDMPGGDRGVACIPNRADELISSLDTVQKIVSETGCQKLNLLVGKVPKNTDRQICVNSAMLSFQEVCRAVSSAEVQVLLEPLSYNRNPDYLVHTLPEAIKFLQDAAWSQGISNASLLLDTYNLADNGADIIKAIDDYGEYVGHVQVADFPSRRNPGTGSLPFNEFWEHLAASGYTGKIGLEYIAESDCQPDISWMSL